GRVVNLFERVGTRLGSDYGKDLDMPVIVLVDGLPVAEILRRMAAAGRRVQHQVKVFGDGANALQGAAQQGCQIDAQAGLIEACTLEGRFVISRQDPGLIRNAGRVRPQSQVISATLDYTLSLTLLLLNDVAENAALL